MSSFSPSHLYYLISLSCNERCTKCHHWQVRPAPQPIDPALIVQAVLSLPDVIEFCIVGGEPLVFSSQILKIVKSIASHPCRTVIVTNGVLLNADFIDRIADLKIHIVVSIDTLNRQKWKFVRGRDTMDRVLENLYYANRVLRTDQLSVQSVLAKETQEDIPKVRSLCDQLGIYHGIQDYINQGFEGEWTPLESDTKAVRDTEVCQAAGRNLSIFTNGDVFTCFQQSWIPNCQSSLGNLTSDRISDILSDNYLYSVQAAMHQCSLPCKVLKCNQ